MNRQCYVLKINKLISIAIAEIYKCAIKFVSILFYKSEDFFLDRNSIPKLSLLGFHLRR